jgi:hypothetical protein
MPFPSGPKIWSWRLLNKRPGTAQKKSRGAMTLLAALLTVAFSVLALGIVYLSQIHLRLVGYKINAVRLDLAAENGLKDGFARASDLLDSTPIPQYLTSVEYDELRWDAVQGGPGVLRSLLNSDIPLHQEGQTSSQVWENQVNFAPARLRLFDPYFNASYRVEVKTRARVHNFPVLREAGLEALLEARAGRIPLPLFLILMGGAEKIESWDEFLEINNITLADSDPQPPGQPLLAAGEDLLPEAAGELVQEAFNIEIFRPQDLTPAKLREAIGLAPSEEPVPDGVYLIRDDLGLGGIYVQGDVTEMILAIDFDYQVAAFRQEENLWILKYSPALSHTVFISPVDEQTFDLVPRGICIVEGSILSLGGGVLDSSGEPVPARDQEIPCILKGVDLTIVCSDTIVLTSHLIHQGVKWQDGIPYIKDGDSQLHLLATGKNLQGTDSGGGEIILQPEGQDGLTVQASLSGLKGGVRIEGENKTIDLLGSLHFPEFDSQGNSLNLFLDTGLLKNERRLQNAPLTRYPVITHSGLRVTAWHSRI